MPSSLATSTRHRLSAEWHGRVHLDVAGSGSDKVKARPFSTALRSFNQDPFRTHEGNA